MRAQSPAERNGSWCQPSVAGGWDGMRMSPYLIAWGAVVKMQSRGGAIEGCLCLHDNDRHRLQMHIEAC